MDSVRARAGTPSGANHSPRFPEVFAFAPTSGYFLTTLPGCKYANFVSCEWAKLTALSEPTISLPLEREAESVTC
jgi:hypothetical protein